MSGSATISITLSLPQALYDRVQTQAAAEGVTVGTEIARILERTVGVSEPLAPTETRLALRTDEEEPPLAG